MCKNKKITCWPNNIWIWMQLTWQKTSGAHKRRWWLFPVQWNCGLNYSLFTCFSRAAPLVDCHFLLGIFFFWSCAACLSKVARSFFFCLFLSFPSLPSTNFACRSFRGFSLMGNAQTTGGWAHTFVVCEGSRCGKWSNHHRYHHRGSFLLRVPTLKETSSGIGTFRAISLYLWDTENRQYQNPYQIVIHKRDSIRFLLCTCGGCLSVFSFRFSVFSS